MTLCQNPGREDILFGQRNILFEQDNILSAQNNILLAQDNILFGQFIILTAQLTHTLIGAWSGGAKVLCISRHRGVQLILAYSWARPAILVAGKGRGGMFLFLLFLHFHSCPSFFPVPLFHLFYSLLSLFSLSLGDDTKWPTRVDVSLNPNTINQDTLIGRFIFISIWRIDCILRCPNKIISSPNKDQQDIILHKQNIILYGQDNKLSEQVIIFCEEDIISCRQDIILCEQDIKLFEQYYTIIDYWGTGYDVTSTREYQYWPRL